MFKIIIIALAYFKYALGYYECQHTLKRETVEKSDYKEIHQVKNGYGCDHEIYKNYDNLDYASSDSCSGIKCTSLTSRYYSNGGPIVRSCEEQCISCDQVINAMNVKNLVIYDDYECDDDNDNDDDKNNAFGKQPLFMIMIIVPITLIKNILF